MRTAWTLLGAILLLPGVARGQYEIAFQASTPLPTLYRIAVQPGALPEDVSALLDAIATQPGVHAGPITISPDGNWYVFHSGRFDAGCAGSTCLTIAPADVSTAETVSIGGSVVYGEGGIALPGGASIVYSDGGGPHPRDLWIVTKTGGVWTGPVLLTGASTYDWNYAPGLSSDGTRVVFDAGPTSFPSEAVAQVGVDGTGFQVLVTKNDGPPPPFGPSTEAHSGSLAPDSSLVFEAEWASGGGLSERIWRRPSGGGTPALVNGAFTNDNSPCVLPDGRIASLYLSAPPPNNGFHEIKIMDADGTNDFLLTTNGMIPGFLEVDDVGMGCAPAAGGGPPTADLAITKTDGQTTVVPGSPISYTITVTNNGPTTVTSGTVIDPVPAAILGPTFTPSVGSYNSGTGAWTGLSLATGQSATLTLAGTVDPAATGTLSNTATVSPPAGVNDPVPGNNSATDTDTVVSPTQADLAVAQSDAPDPVTTGGNVTYSVLVTNNGPAAATGVTLTDTLPAGGAFVSSVPGAPTCTASAGTLSCALGGLGAGTNTSVAIVVQSGAPGTLTNTAAVAANEADPVAANNTAAESTMVVAFPLGELVHGSLELRDLAALPGPTTAEGLFHIHQAPHASYEVVVDGTGADLGSSGPSLERVGSSGTLQSSLPIGAGSSRSLRFENGTAVAVDDQWIRVRSNGCTTGCGPEDVYRIRAYETTYRIARYNNSGTQVTVLVLQNTSADSTTATVWFWDALGSAAGSQPVSLGPNQTVTLNTSAIAPNSGGSITVSNDGRYGALAGKAVAVEPATGFTFDTPLEPRPR